jgi:ligand-binding sensor domain-containing protein
LLLLASLTVKGQYNIAFHHINTQNGLSDNNVISATIDLNGFLWICTSEGLNKFDGRVMTRYYYDEHPQLRNNNICEAICDDQNRLWIRSFGGYISMIDEKQNWHYINIYDHEKKIPISNVIKTKSKGIVLFQGSRQFIAEPGNDTSFRRWQFPADSVFDQRLISYNYMSPDEVLWSGLDEFFIMDYRRGVITERKKVPGITSASAYTKDEIYITTSETGGLYRYNIKTKQLLSLAGLKDQHGKKFFTSLQMISRMADNRMIITSEFAGIYLYDPVISKLVRYMHDPLNRRSVSINNYHNLICDSSGYVLIASPTNGLSYFNVNHKPVSWVSAIRDINGFVFDGYINAIAASQYKDALWMGGYNQLFLWNKSTGLATFFDYGVNSRGVSNRGNEEVSSICTDRNKNVWVGTGQNGIVVLDKSGKFLKQIINDSIKGFLSSNSISNILEHRDTIWISSSRGICAFNANTFKPIIFPLNSPIHFLNKMECGKLWMDRKERLWIGTPRKGAYCFDQSAGTIFNIGLPTGGGDSRSF